MQFITSSKVIKLSERREDIEIEFAKIWMIFSFCCKIKLRIEMKVKVLSEKIVAQNFTLARYFDSCKSSNNTIFRLSNIADKSPNAQNNTFEKKILTISFPMPIFMN